MMGVTSFLRERDREGDLREGLGRQRRGRAGPRVRVEGVQKFRTPFVLELVDDDRPRQRLAHPRVVRPRATVAVALLRVGVLVDRAAPRELLQMICDMWTPDLAEHKREKVRELLYAAKADRKLFSHM